MARYGAVFTCVIIKLIIYQLLGLISKNVYSLNSEEFYKGKDHD